MSDDLDAALAAHLRVIRYINVKYDFRPLEQRAPEDNAVWRAASDAVRALNDAYDADHPTPPCPACGGATYATTGGDCTNWRDNCPRAVFLGG